MNFQSPSERLKDPLHVGSLPGSEGSPAHARAESYPEVNMGNLGSAPKPSGYTPGSSTARTQALWRKEWRQVGARLPWGWQYILADWTSGCWAALHQTHLQPHQALAGSDVHPNKDMHQEEMALCPTGLAFWRWDQAPPSSHWQGLTTVITSCTNLLMPRQRAQMSYEQPGYHHPSHCCQQDLDPSRAVASLDRGALRAPALHCCPSANE